MKDENWDVENAFSPTKACTNIDILRAALLRRRNVNVGAVTQVFSIMENLTEIVFQGKVPGEEDTVMEPKTGESL